MPDFPYYAHRYLDDGTYNVIHYFAGGSRFYPQDQHDYLAWVAAGNEPLIEIDGTARFLSIGEDGQIVVNPNKDALLLVETRQSKTTAVDTLRDAKVAAGMPYTFSDGTGTLQLRDNTDFRNVIGLSATGLALVGQKATIKFRDQEDVVHDMTPEQARDMGIAMSACVSEIYQASWRHKDAIGKLTTKEEIDAYDITTGWPG